MTKKVQTSLRARLRDDTRVSHENLDQRVSAFNLTTPQGLTSFLRMQSLALRAIAPHAKCAVSYGAMQDLLERVESDLRKLEVPGQTVAPKIKPLHPHSIDYVFAGSRLGTRVIKERWQAAENLLVRQADAYFSAPSHIEIWKSFCALAGTMSPIGPLADQIVRDVDRLFQLYQECACAPQITDEAVHA